MRDVIEKLIETEAEAKRIVAEARAEAERILAASRQQAANIKVRGEDITRTEAATIVAAAAQEAERDTRERLATAGRELETQGSPTPATLEPIIDAIVGCVTCQT